MMNQESIPCPDEILAAIPWYPQELDDSLRGEVESHASQCSACREELAFVRDETVVAADLAHRDRVYAAILDRIEEYEGHEVSVPASIVPSTGREGFRFAWQAALAAGLALAVLSGGLGVVGARWLDSAVPVYETVSDTTVLEATAAPTELAPALDVVFRADVRAEDIHSALRAIGAQIVSGPTQLGVYRVELGEDADLIAAARMLRGDEFGVATFAEPAVQ